MKDATGQIWGILHKAKDVTQQIKTQQEARIKESALESDHRFRKLMDYAPVAIGILEGWDMIIASANESLLKLWGKDEKIIGLPMLEALPHVKDKDYMQLLRDVYTNGKPYYGYERGISKINLNNLTEELYFNFIYKPIVEDDGKINQILIVAHEVTPQVIAKKQLEESEKVFKSLILEAPTATAIYTGLEMRVDIANDAMLKLWGKDKAVIGKKLADALPELDGQPFMQLLEEVYTTGQTYHSNESKANLVVDGELQSFYFNFTYKPLFDTNGKVYGILNMAVEVTGQVQARTELEELARKKDEFLSVASHEMKTPLTSLKASMQVINKLYKSNSDSSVIQVFLQKANSNLVRILNLIDDLMQVTKIQQGSLPLNKTWFKLSNLVNECCDHVRADQNYNLVFEGDAELTVFADYARIDQVVVNFVNNAVKYAPNSKNIILRVEKVGNNAKVSVQDFGIGIPLEKQKHLFDRYYRVDYSGIQFSGLGLGLYICEDIVERHGGEIGVNSVVEQGSTFWFTLPL